MHESHCYQKGQISYMSPRGVCILCVYMKVVGTLLGPLSEGGRKNKTNSSKVEMR